VLDIKGGKVRLGIEADEDVTVHRSEVWERIVASDLLGGKTASLAAPYV
jgi:carbon storage regulator CsrA